MWKKRILLWGAVGVLVSSLSVMPVSAHGHHHSRTVVPADVVCEVCTVADCVKTGLHVHGDKTYCGYAHESGYCDGSCDAVRVCTVAGCDETGHHVHDQKTYCSYNHESGYCDGSCDAVEVCMIEGCGETGYHVHDEKIYCGYQHNSGYCDHSCESTAVQVTGGNGRHHGHHGC